MRDILLYEWCQILSSLGVARREPSKVAEKIKKDFQTARYMINNYVSYSSLTNNVFFFKKYKGQRQFLLAEAATNERSQRGTYSSACYPPPFGSSL